MDRLTAVLLMAPVLALLSGDARRHVHVYGDHDHHEHRHGPAAHEHHHEAPAHEDELHIGECEPGQHVLRIGVACSQPLHLDTAVLDLPVTRVIALGDVTSTNVAVTDVRVHGPPAFAQLPLRAPPFASA